MYISYFLLNLVGIWGSQFMEQNSSLRTTSTKTDYELLYSSDNEEVTQPGVKHQYEVKNLEADDSQLMFDFDDDLIGWTPTSTNPPDIEHVAPDLTRVFQPYGYSRSEYREMSPKLASLARNQLEVDHMTGPRFAPLLNYNYEEVPLIDGTIETFLLGDLIAATSTSTIFEIQGKPDLVIKYQADCDRSDSIHPLLRDAWFLGKLNDSGLVPSVLYISPPTPLSMSLTPKTELVMKYSERSKCVENNRTVRFMIFDKIETDVFHYVQDRGADFKNAIEVMIQLVRGLKIIHSHGVIHGDIHTGNVGIMKSKEDPGKANLVFIDFGLAFHIEEKIDTPDLEGHYLGYIHCLYSPWDLLGYRFSFRDDVFKVLMIGAYIMNGQPWMDYCIGLQNDGEEMLRFKQDSFLFEFPGGRDIIGSLPLRSHQKHFVRGKLEDILQSARSVHDINDFPDYDYIINELIKVYRLV